MLRPLPAAYSAFVALAFAGVRTAHALPPSPTALRVAGVESGLVTLEWTAVTDPGVRGYRVFVSDVQGEHLPQVDWNGHPAAFSFTTDDSRPDNLVWSQVAASFGYRFTAFVVSGRIGVPSYLTLAQLTALYAQGVEIAGHSVSHPVMTTDHAFRLTYVGASPSCWLRVEYGELVTLLDGGLTDLAIDLHDPGVFYLDQLAAALDTFPDYECVFEGYTMHGVPTESAYLDTILFPGVDIKDTPYTVTTQKGLNPSELWYETVGCKAALEDMIADPQYVCQTFAYPFHMHDQREMDAVMAAGYTAARNGGFGPHPSGSPVDPDSPNKVDTYEKPATCWAVENSRNETATRSLISSCITRMKRDYLWWASLGAHTLADIDSSHLAWVFDELRLDGEIWVAPFGEVAAYTRQFGITVANPIVAGSSPLICRVTLGGFAENVPHYVTVVAYDSTGENSAWSNEEEFLTIVEPGTGIPHSGAPPSAWLSAYPNPTGGPVRFRIGVKSASWGRLSVYDDAGRLMRRVLDGAIAGESIVAWDGRDERGRSLPSGIYLYRLETPSSLRTGRLAVVR